MSRVPFNFLDRCITLKKPIKQSLGQNKILDDVEKKRIYDWYSCVLYNIYKESKKLLHGKQLFTDDPQSQWLGQFIETLKSNISFLKELPQEGNLRNVLFYNIKYNIPKIPLRIDPFYWSMKIAILRIVEECLDKVFPLTFAISSTGQNPKGNTLDPYSAPQTEAILKEIPSLSSQQILQLQANTKKYYQEYKGVLQSFERLPLKKENEIGQSKLLYDSRKIKLLLDMLANANTKNLRAKYVPKKQIYVLDVFHKHLDLVRNHEEVMSALRALEQNPETDDSVKTKIQQIFQDLETPSKRVSMMITILFILACL